MATYENVRGSYEAREASRMLALLRIGEIGLLLLVVALSTASLTMLGGTINKLLWYVAYLGALGYFVIWRNDMIWALWYSAIMLTWPALVFMTADFSVDTSTTIRSGIQFLMTILIAAYIGARFSLRDIIDVVYFTMLGAGLLSAMDMYGVVSLAPSGGFEEAVGIYLHKNMLGMMMALLAATSLFQFFSARSVVLSLMSLFSAVLAFHLTLQAAAMTAAVTIVLLFVCVPLFLTSRQDRWSRPFVALTLILGSGAVLAFAFATQADIVDVFFDLTGKSRDLTGRTAIWDRAFAFIEMRPWLGYGFDAFWQDTSASSRAANVRLAEFRITHFHNNFIEVLVSNGVVGLTLMLMGMAAFFWRAGRLVLSHKSVEAAFPLVMFSVSLVMMTVESPIFLQHFIYQILFVALFSNAGFALAEIRSLRNAAVRPAN